MSQYISRSSIIAAWCLMLAVTLWLLSPTVPAVALASITVIGLLPAVVLFVFARRPERTTAEVLRAAYSDESA